jgi:phosphoserine aminotransferase
MPNISALNFNKHILLDLKTQIDPKISGSGRFNIPLSPINRSSRQKKINKETLELNDTIGQMNLTDIYKVFHLATAQYIVFSVALWNFLQNRTYFRSQSKS